MLLQNFYKIKSIQNSGDSEFSATLQLSFKHEIFKGHFPKHPVLPGVAMLQISKELIENHLQQKLLLASANRVKFVGLVNPSINNTLKFQLSFQKEESVIKVKNNVTFVSGEKVMHCSIIFKHV